MLASQLDKIKFSFFNLNYKINEYILTKEQTCENCKYFGGLMCDHIDENANCLGWEKYHWHPIKDIIYKYKIKRLARKMREDPSFKHFKMSK